MYSIIQPIGRPLFLCHRNTDTWLFLLLPYFKNSPEIWRSSDSSRSFYSHYTFPNTHYVITSCIETQHADPAAAVGMKTGWKSCNSVRGSGRRGHDEPDVFHWALTPHASSTRTSKPTGLARGNDLCREKSTTLHQGTTQGSGSPLNRCYGRGGCQCIGTWVSIKQMLPTRRD